jgi:hypothetical protein
LPLSRRQERIVIKLTTHTPSRGPTEIRIEGRLDSGSIQSLHDLLDTSPPDTTINLSGLTSIDRRLLEVV